MFLQPLDSAYGLAKHRDGRWEWAVAPGISPSPRYQHAAVRLFLEHYVRLHVAKSHHFLVDLYAFSFQYFKGCVLNISVAACCFHLSNQDAASTYVTM